MIMLEASTVRLLTALNAKRTIGRSIVSGSSTKDDEQRRRRAANCLEPPAPMPASTMHVASTAMSLMYVSSSSIMSGVKRIPADRATFMSMDDGWQLRANLQVGD